MALPIVGIGAAITVVGNWLFALALNTLTIFAKQTLWNIALVGLSIAAFAAAFRAFLAVIEAYVASLLTQSIAPFAIYFLPSNFANCLTIYATVKMAGTIYNWTINFIENKTAILKA